MTKRITSLCLSLAAVIALILAMPSCSTAEEMQYSFTSSVAGAAGGVVTLNADKSGEYELFWGTADNRLDGYTALATVKADPNTPQKCEIQEFTAVPEGATHLLAYSDNKLKYSCEIPQSNRFAPAEPKYCFGALSDVHMGYRYENNPEIPNAAFEKALNRLADDGAGLISVSGDIGNMGISFEYSFYQKIVDKFNEKNPTVPVYTVTGNHDCQSENYRSSWDKYVMPNNNYNGDLLPAFNEENMLDYTLSYGGDLFIYFNQLYQDYNNENSRLVDDYQLDWLQSQLETNTDKRVHLFFHSFFDKTAGYATNGYKEYSIPYTPGMDDTTRFLSLLKTHKNVILYTGHSHFNFESQNLYNYKQNAYTNRHVNIYSNAGEYCHMVHIPSVASPREIVGTNEQDSAVGELYGKSSQGYLVKVYDSCILLCGYDFAADKKVALANYIIRY